jgi:serine/threonine-protein kinase RsbW
MPQERWTWSTEQTIPSHTGAGKAILDEVLEQLAAHDWMQHDIFGVHMAMEEALVNAIKHGNRHDESKNVHVVCKLSPERLYIDIADEGPGFKPDEVPDCTDDDRLEVPSGRGLMLMRCFMSKVEYHGCGNRVIMEKERVHAPQE